PGLPRQGGDGPPPAEADVPAAEVHGPPPELGHADLEGDPRAERRLLEDEGERATGQGRGEGARPRARLPLPGQAEQLLDVAPAQLRDGQEVLHPWPPPPSAASRMADARSTSASPMTRGGVIRRI